MALITGAAYLAWRAGTLGSGALLGLSIPAYAVEVWAFIQLLLLAVQAWRVPSPVIRTTRRSPTTELVDVAIIAAGAEAADLERTLLGTRALHGCGRVIVIDDVDRPQIRDLTQQFEADHVVDGAASTLPLHAVHAHTDSPLYAWLSAGQVPMPEFVEGVSAAFVDPEVAACQAATGLLNASSLAHLRRERDDEALLNRVLGPALSRWGAGPWVGPGAIVRRRALDAVGGLGDAGSVPRLTIRLHQHGWSTRFERRRLVAAAAPETLDEHLRERRRQATDAFRLLRTPENPLVARRLSLRHRVRHIAAISRFTTGVRHATIAALLVATLITGAFPADAPLGMLLAFWALSLTTAVAARTAIARGAMRPGDWVRQAWRTLGADLAGLCDALGASRASTRSPASSTGLRALANLRLLTVAVIVIDVAVLARALTIFEADLLPRFTTGERVAVMAFALVSLAPMVDVLQVVVLRQQRRAHSRLHVALDVVLDGVPATTVDIAPSGVGVTMPFEPTVDAATTLRLQLPSIQGPMATISGQARVRDVRATTTPGYWRVGLEFTHLSETARLALVEFCAVGHVLEHDPAHADLPTAPVGQLAVRREGHHHRSLQVMTAAAAVAAVITLGIGPGARSATAGPTAAVDTICATTAAGDPLLGVVVESTADASAQLLGATGSTGCIRVAPSPDVTGFAVTYEGLRRQLEPAELASVADGTVTVSLLQHTVRVVNIGGEGVPEAEIRYFTDRWLGGPPRTDRDGQATFETLSAAVAVEVRLFGARYVRPLPATGSLTVILSTARLDGAEDTVVEIDRGGGWEPFVDGMVLVPGWIALRSDSGEIVKLEIPESSEVAVPSGAMTPITVEVDDPIPSQTPAPIPEPSATVTATATAEPAPLPSPTEAAPQPSATVTVQRDDTTDEDTVDTDESEADADGRADDGEGDR